jgi:methyl-accepting chemotaxis protein
MPQAQLLLRRTKNRACWHQGVAVVKHEPIQNRVFAEIGEQCGALALHCSETAGFVSAVNLRIQSDHNRLEMLHQSVDQLALLQYEANTAAREIRTVAGRATTLVSDSHRSAISALSEIGALIEDVVRMGDELADFAEVIESVASISENLRMIARQTSILAINASIEAARAGTDASGFAAVAAEVKKLSHRAGDATNTVSKTIGHLEQRARKVMDELHSGADRGRQARARADAISGALETVAALIIQFDQCSADIERCGGHVTNHVDTLGKGLDSFAGTAAANLAQLSEARDQLDMLESSSNAIFNRIGHSGVEMEDSRFIRLALEGAGLVQAIINEALASDGLKASQLFDTNYQIVSGTEPIQFVNGFVDFADARIRLLLDSETARDERIVGCCLIDRNGFLPTHISDRSHPQRPDDRRWNLENSRNRQIFMDRQTRDALDSDGDWFLYTYRQDFGDGRYRALRSVFVPLIFEGRRWGLYEVGYLI